MFTNDDVYIFYVGLWFIIVGWFYYFYDLRPQIVDNQVLPLVVPQNFPKK